MIMDSFSPPVGKFASSVASLLIVFSYLSGCSTGTGAKFSLWEGTLLPVLPNAITGTVAAVTQFGRTEVSAEIRHGVATVPYGWRISSGTCESEGTVQGGIAAYPLLEADESGIGLGDAILSTIFRSGDPYAARVYRNLDGGGEEVVACGNLEETTSSDG